jgi:hypothetical protein
MPGFIWSDAWILLAAYEAGRSHPPTLRRVIAMADLINRVIPTAREINGAIERLSSAGLVTFEEGEIRPTERVIEDARGWQRSSIEIVQEYLGSGGWSAEAQGWKAPWIPKTQAVSDEAFNKAVDEYLDGMKRRKGRKKS